MFSNARVEFKRPFETSSGLKQGGFVIFFGNRKAPPALSERAVGANQCAASAQVLPSAVLEFDRRPE
jgi:hypothetical protein